ncbi:2-succinyl-5-enolpyruvyl-6-hydroxy-3-cyclohexene-1-carboxylic-acid synthase [Croceivirga radicis]|uniref:2-succinyl-5-enolpyruvyl-6-hydroxy-3- cyclohexene-1-carboxylic-acid synthase n=1 Tax=Croceivirga radicis TaxID=1929488 RepID=UPI000255AF7A|nr:2-succinyl-5-enolpyruvyl-6-hydroxy-3-cyclohexene-1-carboxylic-acid synthase [Croceivirga radicis]
MKISEIPSAQAVVQACKFYGVKNIVISPGSRNAPLILSFTNDGYFKCYSVVDERSAAFFALGMAQYLQEPVAVVCTSGSALLNYYPAIAEAFYSEIPLLAISADRPPYKIDVGDGQTIRQDHVYHRHIGYTANLKIDVNHAIERLERYAPELLQTSQADVMSSNKKALEQAFSILLNEKLPVHINIPFEEPLYNYATEPIERINFISLSPVQDNPFLLDDQFIKEWQGAKRKLVLVGVNAPNFIEQKFLEILGNDSSVLVLTETTSNLHHPNFISSIDSLIFPIEKSEHKDQLFQDLQPEILLTFGGLVVSKKVKAFLRNYQPKTHWHVGEGKANDTFFALKQHFKTNVNNFLATLLQENIAVNSHYSEFWNAKMQKHLEKRQAYINQIPFSDFLAFYHIIKALPNGIQVHLSNSSTVRYAQLFSLNPSNPIYCNRGTSGIDGSTSTAVGGAVFYDLPTLLITGDLSFFYDSNAFWNNYVKSNFKVILINNGGGGIFRILPGFDESETFSKYFETQHNLDAKYFCKQFGIHYSIANNKEDLIVSLKEFFNQNKGPSLLEIKTPTNINNKILLDYFDFIS